MTKINNVEMQFQSDKRFKNMIMTNPSYQDIPDYFGAYGCLLTAHTNCYNHYNLTVKNNNNFFTLEYVNNKMIENNGYAYLYYKSLYNNDINKIKQSCFGKEAHTLFTVLDKILNIKERVDNYTNKIDITIPNVYYIIKTKYKDTGHYSWLISDTNKYVDSYDAIIKQASKDQILKITKIIFE